MKHAASATRAQKQKIAKPAFLGTWRIYKMEMWDKDYLDMECKAYIRIERGSLGEFRFGLVQCDIDGEIVKSGGESRFEFTFDGNDEMDPTSGSGWARLTGKNDMEGKIKFHKGDSSLFWAKRLKR